MLFDISNYWIFLLILAAIYVAITMFLQGNIGGKDRLKTLQAEIRQHQLHMTDAAKRKDNKALDEAVGKNWKLTMELLRIQMQMFMIIIGLLFLLMALFPFMEPGHESDIRLALFDDGLPIHCDRLANDGTYSNCYALPTNAPRGAWVIEAQLNSEGGELMAKNSTAIYYGGGKPEDVWLQGSSQSGILDSLLGKTAYSMNITTDRENYTSGQTVEIYAKPAPAIPTGSTLDASVNTGTFFYVDLPFTIPLINIRRIIGSYGFFLFLAFVLSIAYSIGKTIYALRKKT